MLSQLALNLVGFPNLRWIRRRRRRLRRRRPVPVLVGVLSEALGVPLRGLRVGALDAAMCVRAVAARVDVRGEQGV